MGRKPAHFKDQEGITIIVDGKLRVGGLGVVFIAETSADADDRGGDRLFSKGPAGDVHLMDALVTDVAVAGVPEPVPVVMEMLAMWCFKRGRPAPEVKIHGAGNLWLTI